MPTSGLAVHHSSQYGASCSTPVSATKPGAGQRHLALLEQGPAVRLDLEVAASRARPRQLPRHLLGQRADGGLDPAGRAPRCAPAAPAPRARPSPCSSRPPCVDHHAAHRAEELPHVGLGLGPGHLGRAVAHGRRDGAVPGAGLLERALLASARARAPARARPAGPSPRGSAAPTARWPRGRGGTAPRDAGCRPAPPWVRAGRAPPGARRRRRRRGRPPAARSHRSPSRSGRRGHATRRCRCAATVPATPRGPPSAGAQTKEPPPRPRRVRIRPSRAQHAERLAHRHGRHPEPLGEVALGGQR